MWAQMGSNATPDYEFQIGISIGLHRFVSLCTSISYITLNVKYYTELHVFVQILAQNLAPNFMWVGCWMETLARHSIEKNQQPDHFGPILVDQVIALVF
jgi:hypothetical protein